LEAVGERRFGFVQWEFPGRLGPEPGRYPVRRFAGDDVREIVIIGGVDAPRRGLAGVRRKRRPTVPGDGEPAPVEVTRATIVDATPIYERAAAERWLARAAGDEADAVVAGAFAVLARAVAGHRVAAADPCVPDPDPARALATRVGYGTGEQVADGEWEVARELPAPRPPRRRALVPQQRLAALLSGRDVALACEELALRARADLRAGRGREAAMQAHMALEAAVAELESWRRQGDMARRLDELAVHREGVASAANAALQGGLEPAQVELVEAALGRVEAALRARAAAEPAA
jgi:hypothetical protein